MAKEPQKIPMTEQVNPHILNVESLIAEIGKGYRPRFFFFWSHRPSHDGEIDASCLSQWHPSSFDLDGVSYPTAEQCMMAQKALLFGDEETVREILAAPNPRTAKKLGRSVHGFDEELWREHRLDIVRRGNEAKFSQNPDLLAFLLNTENHILVEASPFDRIWGIGLQADDPRAREPENWRGQNLFGFVLMEVRSHLRGKEKRAVI